MTLIKKVIEVLEKKAPLSLQESYDNAGLSVGDMETEVKGVLVSLDCTEEVIDEAIDLNCNLIITHHPLIFSPLKKLTGSNYVERCIIKAIQNNIAIYSSHTNLDSVTAGVNGKIAEKLGLSDIKILSPSKGKLRKIVTYCPESHAEIVRNALFEGGSGEIGNYDHCSFNVLGEGTFRAGENSNPFVGEKNKDHVEKEIRIESIFLDFNESKIIENLLQAHPYEEVAYDIYKLENTSQAHGIGMIGMLENAITLDDFLNKLKDTFHTGVIRHTSSTTQKVQRIAVCGGSGSFLIKDAIQAKADVFVTSDIKYHQFFDADSKIVLADIGHYESEQFTTDLLGEYLKDFFTSFATHFSRANTNPINYF